MQYIQEACLGSIFVSSILAGSHHKPFGFTWDRLQQRLSQQKASFDFDYSVEDTKIAMELCFIITDSHAYNLPLNIPKWLNSHEIKYDSCPVNAVEKGISNSKYNDPAVVVQVLYNEASNLLFIVFVGTINSCMGALDLAYQQSDLTELANTAPGLKCHRGINKLYGSIRAKLINTIMPYLAKNPQIIITGYSLGGGTSQLCALDLAAYNPIHYSFASPMIFNNVGYELFNQLVKYSYRIANQSDIVTLSPLPVMPNKEAFFHVGELIYFQRNFGNYAQNHSLAYVQEYNLVS